MKKIVIGILAHVDAGKTTLSESILYLSGQIRQLGRVDHQDTFLDYDKQERHRGITIFSKQAMFPWKDTQFVLIDTPGHVDFSAEMERTLHILDYAIIVVNGMDGIQSHSETIWHLLEHYHIPTFIFMNKMDQTTYSREYLFQELTEKYHENCLDFSMPVTQLYENLALVNETLLEEYMDHQVIDLGHIQECIMKRQIFPVFFGSALKNEGVGAFLDLLDTYTIEPTYKDSLDGFVYKVSHDEQGNRLTHIKITGGTLQVKEKIHDEKIDQIRLYEGPKYTLLQEAKAGDVVALKGLKSFLPGMTLTNQTFTQPVMMPYMTYRVVLSPHCDQHQMLKNLQTLAQEDPTLHVTYMSQTQDIYVQLMGEIQIEVLQNIIRERFHEEVSFDHGEILYKETLSEPVEGVGHFEPLRHYGEVHVLLEPLAQGSGLVYESQCTTDQLPLQYQRLIMTHCQEIEHPGVLTGASITDIKISLIAGKVHQKHTEGGDLREATYRAIRHGLKRGKSILLEPYYDIHIHIPKDALSRVLYDMEKRHTKVRIEEQIDSIDLYGEGPVACLQDYQQEVIALTKGKGRMICHMKGYFPCHNQEDIIKQKGYDSETDQAHPTGSVFCQHGAGFYVAWDEVEQYMHIPYQYTKNKNTHHTYHDAPQYQNEDEELDAIFQRTYGPIKRRLADDYYRQHQPQETSMSVKMKPECLLVDGYNVIHSWPELKDLASTNLGVARDRLIDILSNYQGYKQCLMIIVFDAYKVKQNLGSQEKHHNVYVVYTKEAQTADMYIERVTHQLASDYRVVVATSDALEQSIVIGRGARRMSSRELALEVKAVTEEHFHEFQRKQPQNHEFLLEDVKDYHK